MHITQLGHQYLYYFFLMFFNTFLVTNLSPNDYSINACYVITPISEKYCHNALSLHLHDSMITFCKCLIS